MGPLKCVSHFGAVVLTASTDTNARGSAPSGQSDKLTDAALLRSLDVRRVGSLRSSFLFTGTIIVLRSCKKILRSLEV